MAVKGVFASDMGIQGERTGDFASALLQVMPTGSAQLLALTSGMQSSDATDTVINWFEENHISGRTKSTEAYDANDTSVVIDDASSYAAGVILMVETTGEYIFTTNIVGNTLTVIRGFAGTTADAIADDGYLQRVSNAFEEGASKPEAVANLGAPFYNYTQIFRNTWNITGTAKAVEYYTGSKDAKNRQDCAMFHSEDIERSLIWGKRSTGVRNNKPFRTMNGVNSQILTNIEVAEATTNYNDFNDFFQRVFSKNIKGQPNERISFVGNGALSVINDIARIEGMIEISPGQTDFGLKVKKWMTPFGDISFMTHPLMTESPLWTKDMYVYHPGAIRTRYLRRTVKDDYSSDGQRAGDDADYGVITTELSIEYKAEVTGGLFKGLTKAAPVT